MKNVLFLILITTLITSCNNKEVENLKYENKINQQVISELRSQITELEHKISDIQIDSIIGKKFVFAVFTIEEKSLDSYNNPQPEIYYKITEIKEFNDFNEEMKYRYMDNCMNDPVLKLKMEYLKQNLKNRQCFVFNSYSEASAEREKYSMNKASNN